MSTRNARGSTKRKYGTAGSARASALAQRLAGESQSSSSSSVPLGEPNNVDKWVVTPDPRVKGIQRALIGRWQNRFVQGQAEGQAGKNQAGLLGMGPRHTIHSLDQVTRYRSTSTTSKRKSAVQRLIESGNVQGAFERVKMAHYHARRGLRADTRYFSRLRAGRFGQDAISQQHGLRKLARDNFKQASKRRRMDWTMM